VIAHEYFHNWSGNRVTCRDWFQLSLKEGFTVLRDQLFSQDMGSEAVKRIEDVRVLRAAQFPEDSGPLAHPIRPDSYQEISNFYTSTVYNKGAEVIRMMRTMAGPERFRAGTDLYFERHDGEAATCEDFIKAIEDGAGWTWSSSACGTAGRHAQGHGAAAARGGFATLRLEQEVPATPGQPVKQPMPIPLRDRAVRPRDRQAPRRATDRARHRRRANFPSRASCARRCFRSTAASPRRWRSRPIGGGGSRVPRRQDDDPFARYEALQSWSCATSSRRCGANWKSAPAMSGATRSARRFGRDPADRARRPDARRADDPAGEGYLAEQMAVSDPGAIHASAKASRPGWARNCRTNFLDLHDRTSAVPYSRDAAARGARKVKTQALVSILPPAMPRKRPGARQARNMMPADNMTDRQGALMVLCGLDTTSARSRLADFHARYAGNALVIDKWFSLQAGSLHPRVLEHVKALAGTRFHAGQPQPGARALHGLGGQSHAFHAASGEGYRLIGDLILAARSDQPADRGAFRAAAGALAADRTRPCRADARRAGTRSRPCPACRAIPASR
jgi:aminopeptidase N